MRKLGRKTTYLQALTCSADSAELPGQNEIEQKHGCYFWGMVIAAGVSYL